MLEISGKLLGFIGKHSKQETIMEAIFRKGGYITPANDSGFEAFLYDIPRGQKKSISVTWADNSNTVDDFSNITELMKLLDENGNAENIKAKIEVKKIFDELRKNGKQYNTTDEKISYLTSRPFKDIFGNNAESYEAKLGAFRQEIFRGLSSLLFKKLVVLNNKEPADGSPLVDIKMDNHCEMIYSLQNPSLFKIQNNLYNIVIKKRQIIKNRAMKNINGKIAMVLEDGVETIRFEDIKDVVINTPLINLFDPEKCFIKEIINIDLNDNKGYRLDKMMVEEPVASFAVQFLLESHILPIYFDFFTSFVEIWEKETSRFNIIEKRRLLDLKQAAERLRKKIPLERDYFNPPQDLVTYFYKKYQTRYTNNFLLVIPQIYSELENMSVDGKETIGHIVRRYDRLFVMYSQWMQKIKLETDEALAPQQQPGAPAPQQQPRPRPPFVGPASIKTFWYPSSDERY
jgi:hypothetical protein